MWTLDVSDVKWPANVTAAGDELLKYLAGIIKEETERADVCGRLVADIFAALIEKPLAEQAGRDRQKAARQVFGRLRLRAHRSRWAYTM